jgi:hypothetical protein
MSNGELTNILVSTDVTRYLEFKRLLAATCSKGMGRRLQWRSAIRCWGGVAITVDGSFREKKGKKVLGMGWSLQRGRSGELWR